MLRFSIGLLLVTLLAPMAERAIAGTSPDGKKYYDNSKGVVSKLADPFVFQHDGTYYLYGTGSGSNTGIPVYTSKDLVNWSEPAGARDGFALHEDDVWGDSGFWSPEVFYANNKFYMIFTVEEHLAVATGDSPLGPFTQKEHRPLTPGVKEIGQKTLRENGKTYIFFSRFDNANVIFGAEMTADMQSIKEDTVVRLIDAEEDWEHTKNNPDMNWPVAEAPLVIKHDGLYYMFYTTNHYKSPDYAVGYAIAKEPLGPYKKYQKNPILKPNDLLQGTGTTSIVKAPNGELYMFYHAHHSPGKVGPRKTAMDKIEFVEQADGSPDVVKVYGPTTTTQVVRW